MKWARTGWPPFVADLLRREPGLCARLIGWRGAPEMAEVISIDKRGRYWLWRAELTKWVNADGEGRGMLNQHSKFTPRVRVLVPVFGPIARSARRDLEMEVRAAADALEG